MSDALKVVETALEKAKERLSKPKPKPDDDKKKPWERMKARGKIRSVAERLLSVANKLEESGKPPNAASVRQLRAMMNELGAAIDAYPSPKRAMKSINMTLEEFTDHAATEIERVVEEQDLERLEQIQTSVESVAHQIDGADVEKIRVDVFEDPAQQKHTEVSDDGDGADMIKAIGEKINELSEAIQSIKAKKPPKKDEEVDMGDDADKRDDKNPEGEETAKAKKPKPEEDEIGKQVKCPECGAMNKEGATECAKCGAKLAAKADTKKADDDDRPVWPTDMNQGRKLSEAEGWGRVKKSVSEEDRSFGPDPAECRD